MRGAFFGHMLLFIIAEALPFLSIVSFVFFYVSTTYMDEGWFVHIHRNVRLWVLIRVLVSILAISLW